jgi:hypothetical protein
MVFMFVIPDRIWNNTAVGSALLVVYSLALNHFKVIALT